MQNQSSLENVVVTGASGFIGSHLVRELVSTGCKPVLLTRELENDGRLNMLDEELLWVRLDLTETNSVREFFRNSKPRVLIHLAGTRGRGDVRGAQVACDELNFRATIDLLRAAMAARVQRIVIVGSAEEYGNQPGPQLEALPIKATSAYGISKARATEQVMRMHAEAGCPVVIVRPFSVYGPGQPSDMFIAEAVAAAVRNVEFRMSHGDQKRDLIFVGDLVRGLVAAASAPDVEGCMINLGSGQTHSLRDVARRIWEISGAQSPLLIGGRQAASEELYDSWADITLARKLLQWEPRITLESGLEQTIAHARQKQGELFRRCQAT